MILGTAGHIDHGKTSLVRALTGVDTDRLPEEKKRGITIDLGFAPLVLEGVGTVGVVDVPGHEGFVRTMLAGASGINLGLLVVAADEGIMPQTREHLEILRLLGVPVPVVALSKSDLVEDEWLFLISSEVQALVSKQQELPPDIVPVSVVTGSGIDTLRVALALAFSKVDAQPEKDLFRMPIDRVFTIRGTGTVVSGTIWSGEVRAGDTLRLLPSGKEARVRRVESHGATLASVQSGSRCAIAISNIPVEEIQRGDVLVDAGFSKATTRIAARLRLDPAYAEWVRKGHLVQMHLGTASVPARIRLPFPEGNADSDYAIIALKGPMVARTGDRFVMRSSSPVATIGGGVVVDPFPARGSIREAIRPEADAEKLSQLLRFSGVRGIQEKELPVRLGIAPEACSRLVSQAASIVSAGGVLFAADAADSVEEKIFGILQKNEANDPLTRGVSLSTARMMTRAAELFDLVVRRMSDRGDVVVEDGLIRRTNWAPSLDSEAQKLADSVLHDICASGREPPSVAELVRKRGGRVPDVLRFLEGAGSLSHVEADRYYDAGVVRELIGTLRGRMKAGQVYSPAELREVLGVSRKYLIPFLEYCDRLGVTERRFEGRVLRGI
jgi:selenocysteine-specific elongation factor